MGTYPHEMQKRYVLGYVTFFKVIACWQKGPAGFHNLKI